MTFEIINDDCIVAMQFMDSDSIDAVVTDPPYGLAFMGKDWDHAVPGVEYWTEVLRVLKPGGHLLAFGGTRLFHRLAVAIEDSGFEVRDCVSWIYGTGFPKSHNLKGDWQGWGTALKPAWEPVIVARKPFKGTVAGNVLEHGTGALNIDGCRVGERWPANLVHDGSDEVTEMFPNTKSGNLNRGHGSGNTFGIGNSDKKPKKVMKNYGGDSGSAARFFYCAKASQAERNAGLTGLPTQQVKGGGGTNNPEAGRIYGSVRTPQKNTHATVKPVTLMAWLCRMVTPPGGTILDPFCGSGSTLVAAIQEGFDCIGIEREAEYAEIARLRCENEEW